MNEATIALNYTMESKVMRWNKHWKRKCHIHISFFFRKIPKPIDESIFDSSILNSKYPLKLYKRVTVDAINPVRVIIAICLVLNSPLLIAAHCWITKTIWFGCSQDKWLHSISCSLPIQSNRYHISPCGWTSYIWIELCWHQERIRKKYLFWNMLCSCYSR